MTTLQVVDGNSAPRSCGKTWKKHQDVWYYLSVLTVSPWISSCFWPNLPSTYHQLTMKAWACWLASTWQDGRMAEWLHWAWCFAMELGRDMKSEVYMNGIWMDNGLLMSIVHGALKYFENLAADSCGPFDHLTLFDSVWHWAPWGQRPELREKHQRQKGVQLLGHGFPGQDQQISTDQQIFSDLHRSLEFHVDSHWITWHDMT